MKNSAKGYICELCQKATLRTSEITHWDNAYFVDKKLYTISRCGECGLVELENKPKKTDMHRYYEKNYYSYDTSSSIFFKMKEVLDETIAKLPMPMSKKLLTNNLLAHPPHNNAAVLDVGCGDGTALQQLGRLGFKYLYGTEINDNHRKNLQEKGIEVSICANIANACLKHDSFDLIRFSHVLEHVYNPLETLRISNKLLKNNGRILIAVPNYDSLTRKTFGKYYSGLQLPTHLYHFNKSTISELLNLSGFKVKRVYTVGYAGFSMSLLMMIRDRWGIFLPKIASIVITLVFVPVDLILNITRQGYILTIEAEKANE